jgi:mannan endo-1,6-alpha-mannosidase
VSIAQSVNWSLLTFARQSIANGGFFQISARLARYTGNTTYLDWANKIWDWTSGIGLIDDIYNVYDGSDELINCTGIDHHQWSYNVGVFLYGSAVLQNFTNTSDVWTERTAGLLEATSTFFSPFPNATNVMFEAACELDDTCNTDQLSKKAYLSRWLAGTSLMAPNLAGQIGALLQTSAAGAAAACSGGAQGSACGFKWYTGGFDGNTGLGQQLAAMEILYSLLVNQTAPPKTLPTVIIRDAPDNVTVSPPVVPVPSGSPRPLHDKAPPPFGTAPGLSFLFTLTILLSLIRFF